MASLDRILALAASRDYGKMTTLLTSPQNHSLCWEAMNRLEALGDKSFSGSSIADALNLYAVGLACGTILMCVPGLMNDPLALAGPVTRLNEKTARAREAFHAERQADETQPASLDRVIELALMSRFTEAGNMLGSLDGNSLECARRLRAAAEGVPEQTANWFYQQALDQFERAASQNPTTVASPPVQTVSDPSPEDRGDAASERGEWNTAIGHYRTAAAALAKENYRDDRILRKLYAVEMSIVNEKIAVLEVNIDELLNNAGPTDLEKIGDRLEPTRPDLALQFYRKFHEFAQNMSADTGLEGYQRASLQQSAAYKLAQATARTKKLRARFSLIYEKEPAIEVSLGHQETLQLKLTGLKADWRFRVSIEGAKVRLVQIPGADGRMLPYGVAGRPDTDPLILGAGEQAVIYYNVPGGGPRWTVKVIDIR